MYKSIEAVMKGSDLFFHHFLNGILNLLKVVRRAFGFRNCGTEKSRMSVPLVFSNSESKRVACATGRRLCGFQFRQQGLEVYRLESRRLSGVQNDPNRNRPFYV